MMRNVLVIALVGLFLIPFATPAFAQGSTTLDAQTSGPVPANVLAGQSAVVGAFDLAAAGDDVTVHSLSISGSGSGNDLVCAGVLTVRLVEDVDKDGAATGIDTTIDSAGFSEDNGSITFTTDVSIAYGTSTTLLVVYEFTELARDGATFRVTLDAISATDTASAIVAVSGLPATSADTTITNPNPPGLTVTGIAVPDREVAAGSTHVVARVAINATGALQSLQSLSLQAAGTGRDDLDIVNVELIRDVDGNGQVDATDDVLGSGTFSSDNGSLVLNGGDTTLYIGITANLLVSVSFGPNVPQNSMFGLTVTSMVANGSPVVSGLPLTGAALTVTENPGADQTVGTGGCTMGATGAVSIALFVLLISLFVIRRLR